MTVKSKNTKIASLFLAIALTFSLLVPVFSLDATAATVAGDLETTPGMNSYSLFNSGATGSGRAYSSYSNYNDSSYTNGGYDIYATTSGLPRVRLGLSFTVSQEVTERAALTVYAYDVDEDDGERDIIYLVDETTGAEKRLDGYLSGMNSQWNTTTLYIDPSYFEEGHTYHFELYESVNGWVVYVRTVAIRLVTAGTPIIDPDAPVITDHSFSASISSSRVVSTNLFLKSSDDVTYTLEYAASVNNSQRGSSINQSIAVTPDGTTKALSFSLESNAPAGVYQIDVIIKDSKGNMVAIYTTTAGYDCYAVSYHSNGGSSNLPIDQSSYRKGNTVNVKFDYLPSRTGFVFAGWATDPSATEPEFTSDGRTSFVIGSSDVSLYAVWKKPYTGPEPGTVLIIEDYRAGVHQANSLLLDKLKSEGKIISWSKIKSSDVTANKLRDYSVVYVEGAQSIYAYRNIYDNCADVLEEYVMKGGTLIYGACITDEEVPLPFGVTSVWSTDKNNYIADASHPIINQLYSSRIFFPESKLTGFSISQAYLSGLPESSRVILTDTQDRPTLAEYKMGDGKVIATTNTWEYTYMNPNTNGTHKFSVELYDDLILYAISETANAIHLHTVNWEYDTVPTCTTGGKRHGECTACGDLVVETVSPLGHDYTVTDSFPATCTSDGHSTMTCDTCGSIKHQIIFAKGHEFDEDGLCECGLKIEIHNHECSKTVTEPTCTTVGYTTYVCSCGYSYRDDYVDQLGHRFDEGRVTLEATCTTDGSITYTCTECQATYDDVILASHAFSETVTLEPTCTTDGTLTLKCDECGHVQTEAIPAEHKYDEGKIILAPTCGTPGMKECNCSVCGEIAEIEIAKLGHCFYDGRCTVCGATITEIVTPNETHPEYGMFFEIDDTVSGYGPDLVNEYGVLLDFNADASIKKVAVFLVQEGNMWRRCIACVGDNITYATYVPYLSYGKDIKYTGLNSQWINTFSLSPNKDGIWSYDSYTTIGVNLADAEGNLLLSLYDIGQAGAKTRVFDDLDKMVRWLKEDSDCINHYETDWIIDKEATTESAGARHKTCEMCKCVVAEEIVPPLAQITVESRTSAAGGIFEIAVSIKNNPGILSAIFNLTFNPNLTLIEVRAAEAFGSLTFTAPESLESGCEFIWDGRLADTTDGCFLILVFKLSENANDSSIYGINLSYAGGSLVNSNGTDMDVSVKNSQIKVHNVQGDANNDGEVDTLDVIILRRYLAGGYGVAPTLKQSDINGDGYITIADVVLLRRMILSEA